MHDILAALSPDKVRWRRLPIAEGLPRPDVATPGAAGLDLVAAHDVAISPNSRSMVGTGWQVAIPQGWMGMVCPRSGMALAHGITVLNAPGIIDSDYRGEIGVILINTGMTLYRVKRGDRVAQLVMVRTDFLRMIEVDSFGDETERGEAGFGSTGS